MATRRLSPPGAVKRRVKQTLGWLGFYVLLVVIVLYTVFPFYWAIVSSLRSGRGPVLDRRCSRPIRPGATTSPCSASSRSAATS